MNVVRARSGDANFLEKIRLSGFRGVVHSVFNRTFNIHCPEDGDLYTVAGSSSDNAPHTLVTERSDFRGLRLAEGDEVRCEAGNLFIGDKLTVQTAAAEQWKSVLPPFPKDDGPLRMNLAQFAQYVNHHGVRGGMIAPAASGTVQTFEAETLKLLEQRSKSLLLSLSDGRCEDALTYAVGLVGLGPGLTPSGDDYLVGLFAVANMEGSPASAFKALCEEVARRSRPLTNEISYMALKKASQGQVRESVLILLHALIGGNREEWINAAKTVLNIGSSSGTDIARGLTAGLELRL